jgi:glycerol-3-phosphate O-acyltransferase
MGFFMRNLGAYTVDRTKTDPLYRDTLKEYVTVLLEHGQHNLFFPGGTRSRSGALESHLKLGLLGTTATAFRNALVARSAQPRIFVVPCTITYPLVLEAATLVEDYLRAEGGAHYIDARDESDHPRRWFDFLAGLTKLDHRVYVTIGRPLDVIGNEVDERGTSHDPHGKPLDPSRYFLVNGKVEADDARDKAYTRLLASSLVSAYRRDNLALPTSATAFVVLALLRKERREPDLFRFLRGVSPDASVSVDSVIRELGRLMGEIRKLTADSSIRSSETLGGSPPDAVLAESLRTFATYHPTKVIERRADRLVVGDVNLLFYYGNRLSGYALLGEPSLLPERRNGAH